MRSKKNEPLSNLRNRTMRFVEKEVSVTPVVPGTERMWTASLATSVEEIIAIQKKPHVADKGKEKVDSRSSSVWDDARSAWQGHTRSSLLRI